MNLSILDPRSKQEERKIWADLNFISSNLTRASILHLLIKSKETKYSLSLNEISFRLGKYHRVVTHHLEKLQEYGLVEVVKNSNKKRKIWGLNLSKVDLIKEVYAHILKNFFTLAQLERACSVNKKLR